MSLNWQFDDCFGRMIDKCGNSHFLYACNGLVVALNEWLNEKGEAYYCMYDFRVSIEHDKNCVKDGIYMFKDMRVEVALNKMEEVLYTKKDLNYLKKMMREADEIVIVKDFEKVVEPAEVQNERMRRGRE